MHTPSWRAPSRVAGRAVQRLAVTFTYRVVSVQAATVTIVAAGLVLAGAEHALGALATGVACIVPAAWYAHRVEQTQRVREAHRVLGANIGRLVSTVCLLAAVLVALKPTGLGFLAGLVSAQVGKAAGLLALKQ